MLKTTPGPCCVERRPGCSVTWPSWPSRVQLPLGALAARRQPRRVTVHFFREDRAASTPHTNGVHSDPPGGRVTETSSTPAPSLANGTTVTATTTSTPSPSPPPPSAPAPPVPAAAAPTAAAQPPPPGFTARRLLVFSGLVLGYAAYYLTRNSLTYTAPLMVADPQLGFTMGQVGTMTSIFPIAYGTSKLLSGIVGDRFSPSLLLGAGLLATSACNLAFGAGSGLAWFAAMWALNGVMQGVGAPSCARILTSWFAAHERGTYWGLWNVAHNTGGFASPLLAATAAHAAGWRWGMWAPGLVAAALAVYVLLVCRDTPRDTGFALDSPQPPPAPQPAPHAVGPAAGSAHAGNGNGKSSGAATAATATAPGVAGTSGTSGDGRDAAGVSRQQQGQAQGQQQQGLLRMALDNVLTNPYVWALALTYFFVYVVRQGVTSWSVFYLINEKGVPDVAQAAVRVSGLELGGLVGGLVAGRLSDLLIRADARRHRDGAAAPAGSVGMRVQVVMGYTAALAAALAAFRALPAGAPPLLQWLAVAAIGFCIYGPQMMIGLCGAELVHPASVGASQGVLGWVAYLGAANAGVPLSYIITRFGWSGYFAALTAACAAALLLMAPMARLRSYSQQAEAEAEEVRRQAEVAGAAAAAPSREGGAQGGVMAPRAA